MGCVAQNSDSAFAKVGEGLYNVHCPSCWWFGRCQESDDVILPFSMREQLLNLFGVYFGGPFFEFNSWAAWDVVEADNVDEFLAGRGLGEGV